MGLYLSKQDNQTELQKRITADLRIKASAKAKQAEAALAWVGNVLFLAGCIVMLVWLDWKLALLTKRERSSHSMVLEEYPISKPNGMSCKPACTEKVLSQGSFHLK